MFRCQKFLSYVFRVFPVFRQYDISILTILAYIYIICIYIVLKRILVSQFVDQLHDGHEDNVREQKIIEKGIHAADRLTQTRLEQVFQHFGWCARHYGISAGVEEVVEVAEYDANIIEIRSRASGQ